MKNVLIVNQSAELYGADKALLELIQNYPKDYNPIVVLHQEGPLKDILIKMGVQVIHCSVIKVKRGILKPLFFLKLPFEILSSFRTINKELKGKQIDLVHSNAISVFIGAFYSFVFRKKHLWHVHEIIEHPKMLASAYPKIVAPLATRIVFNSNASFAQFDKIKKGLEPKSVIVHNGQDRTVPVSSPEEIEKTKRDLFSMPDTSHRVIGLVGRISRLKGQIVLIQAFAKILKKHPDTYLVFAGSAPEGQEHFLHRLEDEIQTLGLEKKAKIIGFQDEIWPVYDAIDISVVPSTEPESFGLVATESMLSGKPVIGSRLGGLREIIEDGENGYLFEAGNVDELAQRLDLLLSDSEKTEKMGEEAGRSVRQNFSMRSYVDGIGAQYDLLTNT